MHRLNCLSALIAFAILSPISSANSTAKASPRWSYNCHQVDRRASVGELIPQFVYERIADYGSPSYAITVYRQGFVERNGELVYLWARVVIFDRVPEPGCWRARILKDSFKEIQSRLLLEKELSESEAMSIATLMDTATEVATLIERNGDVRRFMASSIGMQLLRAVVGERKASEIAKRIGE